MFKKTVQSTSVRVAYVVNHVAFFVSHRLPLVEKASQSGIDVILITGRAGSDEMEGVAMEQLKSAGVTHRRAIFRTSGINPLIELVGLLQVIWFLFKFRPDIVHCASPKGVLYGGLAARVCRVRGLVLAISGMGYAYTLVEQHKTVRAFVRKVYDSLSRFAFRHPNMRVIVQNQDDYQAMIDDGSTQASCLRLIPGSGVELSKFKGSSSAAKSRTILLPARMLRDKGVEEFVDAARQIKTIVSDWRFLLAGAAGYANPSAIEVGQLQSWQTEGHIEWLGHVNDIIPLFQESAIVCLPSYREGMPKSLLEAAAAGCAVVTTDVTGCREAIEPGVTGDLVPVRDSKALADAILSLIRDDQRRQRYGALGQERARALFSIDSVVTQTIKIYKELFAHE